MRFPYHLAILSPVFLAVFWLHGEGAWAGDAIEIDRAFPNQFPARVEAIVFEDTIRIDASEPLGFGAWTVRFGPNNPVAYYRCDSPCLGNPPPVIRVEGLLCDGTTTAGSGCLLLITLERDGPADCAFAIDGMESEQILIDCPSELLLP